MCGIPGRIASFSFGNNAFLVEGTVFGRFRSGNVALTLRAGTTSRAGHLVTAYDGVGLCPVLLPMAAI